MSFKPFKLPFNYDPMGACIFDADNNKVIDIRAWGYLTGKGNGALGLNDEEAIEIQNNMGQRIVELMNND